MKHYVYRHIRLDTNTPFYVGKGSSRRAFQKSRRNRYWENITEKHEYKIEIIKYFKDEKEAYIFEQRLIDLYKKFGYCEANLKRGGLGGSLGQTPWNKGKTGIYNKNVIQRMRKSKLGRVIPEAIKLKMSKSHTGKKKKPLSENHKSIISNRNRLKIPFQMFDLNGILQWEGDNMVKCAELINGDSRNIRRCLLGKRKSHMKHTFKYVGGVPSLK